MESEFDRKLTRREAAEFLTHQGYSVAPTTLAKYATVGGGPVFEKFGRRPDFSAVIFQFEADLLPRGNCG